MAGYLEEPSTPRDRANPPLSPDVILLNGKVFTSHPAHRYAQAVAIAGDRVLAVGVTNEIAALADAHTRRIDLAGRVVIPGINDAHFHHTPDPRASLLSFRSMEPSWEEVLDALAAAVKEAPKGSWILGTHGINVVNDPRATRFELDRISPDHPVRLNAYFGHGSVLNSKAIAAVQMSERNRIRSGDAASALRVPNGLRESSSATRNGHIGADWLSRHRREMPSRALSSLPKRQSALV